MFPLIRFMQNSKTIIFISLFLLSACASNPVQSSSRITLTDIQMSPESYRNQIIRLGGKIVNVVNKENFTEVEVADLPLNSSGRPRGQNSSGRFIAVIPNFLDPIIYTEGRLFTVIGSVNNVEIRKVGEQSLSMIRLNVSSYRLWQNQTYPVYAEPVPFYGNMYLGTGYRYGRFGLGIPL